MIRLPTWVYEQAVLALMLVPGLSLAIQQDPTARGAVRASLTCAGAMAAQKARSGADRRREQDELRGVSASRLRCDRAISRWATVAQVISILGALVPAASVTRWTYLATALPLAYSLLYGAVWRPWYRARRPATLEAID